MNITFLIGNGFDLNLNLKTQFSDFLKVYKNDKSGDSETISYFKDKILHDEILWSNAELAFGKSTATFVEQGLTDKDFSECHRDFCNNLGKYLELEERKISFILPLNQTNFNNGVYDFTDSIDSWLGNKIKLLMSMNNEINVFNFISFNYTSTIDKFVNGLQRQVTIDGKSSSEYKKGNIIHIHGYTNKDMMLGVNDESQIVSKELFKNKYYRAQIIKPQLNALNESGIDNEAFDLLKNSDIVYIFGMSLGETDALWWNRLNDLLKQKENLHIIIYSREDIVEEAMPINKVIAIGSVKDRFQSFSSFNELEKEVLGQRIHVVFKNTFEKLNGIYRPML